MKILKLQVENVKKLKAALIEPDPKAATVVLTGDNEAGKSCALDAIQWGLEGPKALPPDPITYGEDKARVRMKLGDPGERDTALDLTRTVDTTGKGTLVIKDAKGTRQKSPQGLLDRIYGSRTIDPGAFALLAKTAEGRRKQVKMLEGLVDFKFEKAAKERKDAYDKRQIENRQIKRLQGALAELPEVGDAPELVDVSDLVSKLEDAEEVNAENARKRRLTDALSVSVGQDTVHVDHLEEKIAEMHKELEQRRATLDTATSKLAKMAEACEGLEDTDTAALRSQINDATGINNEAAKHAQLVEARARLEQDIQSTEASAHILTQEILDIDDAKQKALDDAKLPVPGMTFDPDGVKLDGIPFEQASTEEAIRVSVLMGIHLNPQLKIMLVRDGNAFDKKRRPMLAEIADEFGMQLWIEEHDSDDPAAVVIEEGRVAQ